jgi:hypothetical protein
MKRLLLPLLFLPLMAHAQVYKCSLNGKTTYSSTPCEGKSDAKVINTGQDRVTEAQRQQAELIHEKNYRAVNPECNKYCQQAKLIRAKQAAKAAATPSQDELAQQCVDLYKPHLAYQGVRINSSSITGIFPEIIVNVRTITNDKTPVERDPITINERFICRLTEDKRQIDKGQTQSYLDQHKRGGKL